MRKQNSIWWLLKLSFALGLVAFAYSNRHSFGIQ